MSFQRKELTSLILSILPNFNDTDEKVTLTALEVVTKEVAYHKYASHVLLKIVKQLQPFLVDVSLEDIIHSHERGFSSWDGKQKNGGFGNL